MNFDAVIRRCAQQAVAMQIEEHEKHDLAALQAANHQEQAGRNGIVRGWLRYYGVFQGFFDSKRAEITDALLMWSDARILKQGLDSSQAIVEAHSDLMATCVAQYGMSRDFTSLASKYLWLCYPTSVPLFDKNVRQALQVLSKLEDDIALPDANWPQYHQFVMVWKELYERHSKTLDEMDFDGYDYSVRIFDKILWLVGENTYGLQ